MWVWYDKSETLMATQYKELCVHEWSQRASVSLGQALDDGIMQTDPRLKERNIFLSTVFIPVSRST
jgi:hypothetical protein